MIGLLPRALAVAFALLLWSKLTQGSVLVHWALNEGSGTTVLDSAGNLNGVHVGDPAHVAGQFGGGLDLDSDDYAISSGSLVLPTAPFTAALWFNRSAADNEGVLFRNGQFSIQYEGGSAVRGYVNVNGGWVASVIAGAPALGSWEHYALVWDTTTLTLHRDGAPGTVVGVSGTLTNGDGGANSLYVGDWVGQGTWNSIGRFDEAYVFDEALTGSQINDLIASNSSAVPEATEAALILLGLSGLFAHRRRRH